MDGLSACKWERGMSAGGLGSGVTGGRRREEGMQGGKEGEGQGGRGHSNTTEELEIDHYVKDRAEGSSFSHRRASPSFCRVTFVQEVSWPAPCLALQKTGLTLMLEELLQHEGEAKLLQGQTGGWPARFCRDRQGRGGGGGGW